MNQLHDTTAQRLREAYQMGPIASLRQVLDPNDSVTAYAVQEINNAYWTAGGRQPMGYKIGLTSAATQSQLGTDQPNFGVLYRDMAVEDGAQIPRNAGLQQPRVEGEVALVMDRELKSADATMLDVLKSVAFVAAAIEVVDSRIARWEATSADMIADNGFAARYVLSQGATAISNVDLLTCGMVLEINGKLASLGVGAASMGHPLMAAAWLARALAQSGRRLAPGDVILTGSLGPMVAVKAGDWVQVRVGGLGSARVGFQELVCEPG